MPLRRLTIALIRLVDAREIQIEMIVKKIRKDVINIKRKPSIIVQKDKNMNFDVQSLAATQSSLVVFEKKMG